MSARAEPSPTESRPRLDAAAAACAHIVLGKEREIRLALACLLAHGHLLIEDVPGVGKTTLAHALARVLDLEYRRVQFTSDLLPADVLGTSIFERDTGAFRFHPGPVFTQLLLADEINRAPPKTQSALLEAMEEQQVTVEGETRALPRPFFVIATQNPREQAGTFALPESQLDRFLMRISLGFPGRDAERELLDGNDRRRLIDGLDPVMSPAELVDLQAAAGRVHASAALLDYVQRLLAASRAGDRFVAGLSPRAGIDLLQAARAWALLDGREFVLPEDVQAVLGPVVDHRLQPLDGDHATAQGQALVETVPVD
ncbi:MAG: AAA family ATPase [Halofilum sp. (in: g-proteobacteria)]|nr:AAA family ATPase [Halofilum sp. (in: g-proteobacteria)]